MKEALTQTLAMLGEDTDGIKILSCMLSASADAHGVYQKMGIPDEIYFATMKGCSIQNQPIMIHFQKTPLCREK